MAVPFADVLRKYSIATASLVASIMFKKFALGIPLYRQEWDLQLKDFPLFRQNMANWIVFFALNLFGPVYDWMWQELKKCRYIQNDETLKMLLEKLMRESVSYYDTAKETFFSWPDPGTLRPFQ